MPKYIFVAGGVMSGIGKGVTTASIGKILKSYGYKVTAIKIDPYVNVDAGTMNPIEHGEVFVTGDGTECDQDIGNYERFIDENLSTINYITTGRVYQSVINRERNLEYDGKCVEVVPHIPQEVIDRIKRAGKNVKADFILIEIGGTVGEYQNSLFLEAARMMRLANPRNVLFVLISYLPVPSMIGEMKSKPTQQAVRWLNMAGIQPNIIIARSVVSLDEPRKKKISVFCNVDKEDVISAPDVKFIYEIPINFEKDNLGNRILKKFGMKKKQSNMKDWNILINTINTVQKPVKIGIVGKYFETGKFTLTDSYISVIEAVKHAAWFHKTDPQIFWLSSEDYEKNSNNLNNLKEYDGIIVPGGFGGRGIEGKIKVIEFCRKNKIPFFGLCLGMQLAVIEFARNVCGIKNANSAEFVKNNAKFVIDVMPEQKALIKEKKYGATMRLGDYDCQLNKKTKSFEIYKNSNIVERHRHRYEINNDYRQDLEKGGLVMAGINPQKDLVEIIELPDHPFYIATQFHPEFNSRPTNPHPLFSAFIKSMLK